MENEKEILRIEGLKNQYANDDNVIEDIVFSDKIFDIGLKRISDPYFYFQFENCVFENCMFKGAYYGYTFRNCQFKNIRAVNSVWGGVQFFSCNIQGLTLLETATIVIEKDIRKEFMFDKYTRIRGVVLENDSYIFVHNNISLFERYINVLDKYKALQSPTTILPIWRKGPIIGYKTALVEENDGIANKADERLYDSKNWHEKYRNLPDNSLFRKVVIKLEIPTDAIILSWIPEYLNASHFLRYRTNKAKVLEIYKYCGEYGTDSFERVPINDKAYSFYDPSFSYEIGKVVQPKETFNPLPYYQFSPGIHFFMTEDEAIKDL